MTILIDCNILMDVAQKRGPHFPASNQILCRCKRGELRGAVAFHSIANLWYLHKKPAKAFLEKLLPHVEVFGGNAKAVEVALAWTVKDFEDALQIVAAQSAKAQFIVTRNVKDFKFSPVPAMSPADYLARFH